MRLVLECMFNIAYDVYFVYILVDVEVMTCAGAGICSLCSANVLTCTLIFYICNSFVLRINICFMLRVNDCSICKQCSKF